MRAIRRFQLGLGLGCGSHNQFAVEAGSWDPDLGQVTSCSVAVEDQTAPGFNDPAAFRMNHQEFGSVCVRTIERQNALG